MYVIFTVYTINDSLVTEKCAKNIVNENKENLNRFWPLRECTLTLQVMNITTYLVMKPGKLRYDSKTLWETTPFEIN